MKQERREKAVRPVESSEPQSSEKPQNQRQERNAMFKADYDSKCQSGPVIVIDCDWADKMTERELLSLTQQIMYAYAANRRAEKPARICLLGVSDAHATLIRKLPGFATWSIPLSNMRIPQTNTHTVYLTADTENILTEQQMGNINTLVIGGIVDRNRHKNATLLKAEELNIPVAQLPIGEYMPLKSSKVLTVNHVVEILLEFLHHKDWKLALDTVIPDRKKDIIFS